MNGYFSCMPEHPKMPRGTAADNAIIHRGQRPRVASKENTALRQRIEGCPTDRRAPLVVGAAA